MSTADNAARGIEGLPPADCGLCDGSGYTCKGACFGQPTCDGKPCPNGCKPEGLFARGFRALRADASFERKVKPQPGQEKDNG